MTRTIIFADHEPENARPAISRLRKAGYEVDIAEGSAHAIDEIRRRRPDLVLLELPEPEAAPDPVWRRLSSDPEFQGIAVVVLSRSQEDAFEGAVSFFKPAACLVMPFEAEDLYLTIRRLLG